MKFLLTKTPYKKFKFDKIWPFRWILDKVEVDQLCKHILVYGTVYMTKKKLQLFGEIICTGNGKIDI